MTLVVAQISETEFADWDRAVAESPAGSPYSTSTYLSALASATSNTFKLIAVLQESRIIGGVGLFLRGGKRRPSVRGRYLLYYNGPFVRRPAGAGPASFESVTQRVLSALENYLSQAGFSEVCIKGRHPLDDIRVFIARGWRVRPVYSYEVDISDLDDCQARMHRNVRRQIRQAQSSNILVSQSDDFDTFYGLHAQTAERKQFAAYLPKDRMAQWFFDLQKVGMARLYLAHQSDNRAMAGLLVLAGDHPVSHTVAAGSGGGKIPQGINAWLRWKVFEDLSAAGHTANDLTDAHEPSVARFKSQLGAKLVVSHELRLPPTLRDQFRAVSSTGRQTIKKAIKSIVRRENR